MVNIATVNPMKIPIITPRRRCGRCALNWNIKITPITTAAGMLIITTVQASATPRLLRYRSGIQYSPQIADEMTTAAEAKLVEGLRMVMTLFSKLSIDLSR